MASDLDERAWLGRGWHCPVMVDLATGGTALADYEADIRQSLRILLGTAPGERLMRPEFGCGLHALTFESMDVAMLTRLQALVSEAVRRYETRIELTEVTVDTLQLADGRLHVALAYRIRRTNQSGNLVYPFFYREQFTGRVTGSRG